MSLRACNHWFTAPLAESTQVIDPVAVGVSMGPAWVSYGELA